MSGSERDPHPELPVDPDAAGERPLHLQWRFLLLIFAGGLVGAPCRFLLAELVPARENAFPWATFGTNLAGAFALGLLLEALARRGTDAGSRRAIRLGIGTGVLGAFTTYSALGTETVLLVRAGSPEVAAVYAFGSAAAGLLAAAAGIALVARRSAPAR